MQTPTLTRPKPTRGASQAPRPDDFRRLGLGPTEARVTVIRKAAGKLAAPLASQNDPMRAEQAETELALVLAATYRLLDPRRRNQLIERVQLLRAEPTPLRSHLLENVLTGTLVEATAVTAEEQDEEQQIEISEHDWMLESLAELQVAPPVWKRSNQRIHEAHTSSVRQAPNKPKPDKHRAQMLEVARYLQSGNSRISRLTGILGSVGLLLVGAMLVVTINWFTGGGKEASADPLDATTTERAETSVATQVLVNSDAVITETDVAPPISSDTSADSAIPTSSSETKIEFETSGDPMYPVDADDPFSMFDSSESTLAGGFESAIELESNIVDSDTSGMSAELSPTNPDSANELEANPADKALTDESIPDKSVPSISLPLDSDILQVPAEDLATPILYPLPERAELQDAIRKLRNVGAGQTSQFPIGRSAVIELWRQSQAAAAGSTDRLALIVTAGRQAVLLGEQALSMAIAKQTSQQYASTPTELGSLILADAAEQAVTLTEQERVIEWGLRISDWGILEDDYKHAEEAARIATATAAKHGDPDLRARLKQRRDTITIAERMAASIADQPLATPETTDRSIAWHAGRHLCLNQRNWDEGLIWLSVGSDVRFAALANEELALNETKSASEIASVAGRWLEMADRRKGREQDSIRLHARDLLLKAAARAEVIERLELEKETQAIIESLPVDLHELELSQAIEELEDPQADAAKTTQSPPASAPATPSPSDPLTIGMLGRLVVAGQDTGVVLRYPSSIAVPIGAIEEVVGRLGMAAGQPVAIEFHGCLQIDKATTIRIAAEGPLPNQNPLNPSGVAMSIASDSSAAPQQVPLQINGTGYAAVLDLPAGLHRVVWKVSGDQFAAIRLIVRDDRDGQLLQLRHDQVTEDLIRRLPVRLNVDFQAR